MDNSNNYSKSEIDELKKYTVENIVQLSRDIDRLNKALKLMYEKIKKVIGDFDLYD